MSTTAPSFRVHPFVEPSMSWSLSLPGRKPFAWKGRTVVMGILNATPDSFSDGGRFMDPARALEQAQRMQEEGADWIDLGGESTRPGSRTVPSGEEKARILPILKACARKIRIPISVDTSRAEVARAAVGEGARMVNDVSALRRDRAMARTVARLKVPLVLMHMKGRPRTMQKAPRYSDVVGEVLSFLRGRVEFAVGAGVRRDRILVDPGFGFGKLPSHNLELVRRLHEFRVLGRPVLMGPSRKATLGHLLGGLPPSERLEATLAVVTASVLGGADWVRVHDVKETIRAVKVADALRYGRGVPE
jgi:dihydropteroate synthase